MDNFKKKVLKEYVRKVYIPLKNYQDQVFEKLKFQQQLIEGQMPYEESISSSDIESSEDSVP